jgi:hypothetical protein
LDFLVILAAAMPKGAKEVKRAGRAIYVDRYSLFSAWNCVVAWRLKK